MSPQSSGAKRTTSAASTATSAARRELWVPRRPSVHGRCRRRCGGRVVEADAVDQGLYRLAGVSRRTRGAALVSRLDMVVGQPLKLVTGRGAGPMAS